MHISCGCKKWEISYCSHNGKYVFNFSKDFFISCYYLAFFLFYKHSQRTIIFFLRFPPLASCFYFYFSTDFPDVFPLRFSIWPLLFFVLLHYLFFSLPLSLQSRPISPGEELTMDYYSITTSDIEWRAAICLCGQSTCRGSFLHYATQDDLQQVLNQNCGPLWRYTWNSYVTSLLM